MRLWILSDLHLELTQGWDLPPPADRPDFDVMIVAGDLIPRAERGVKWLAQRVTDRPVLYVAGNHEFYGADETRTIEKAKVVAAGTSVRVLQNEAVRICDVSFVGATLWTDFELLGDRPRAMRVAGERMNDFRKIRTGNYLDRVRPKNALARHVESRAFFEAEFRKARPGPLVAISHHAPLSGAEAIQPLDAISLSDEEILTAAYRSALTRLMVPAPDDGRGPLRPADLWVYGHTHESFDAIIGATRVVSNAKGYGPWPGLQPSWDNPNFNPSFIVEI
jgi:predicted phosphodiesterase